MFPLQNARGGFVGGLGTVTAGAITATTIDTTGAVTAAGGIVGNLTGNSNGTHTGAVVISDASSGLQIGSTIEHAPLPETNAQFEAATTLTAAAWWRMDWLNTGNAVSLGDTSGTLTSGGSPTFHALSGNVLGVHYDASTGDAHSADVLDTAANSFVAGGRFGFLTDPGGTSHHLIGRTGATGLGWYIAVNDSGDLLYNFSDGVLSAFTGTLASALITASSRSIDLAIQIDRSGANPILRARWSRAGATIGSTSVTLTALGTLAAVLQEFGFGAIPVATPALNGGAHVAFAYVAIGSQAEGTSKNQTISEGLGFE